MARLGLLQISANTVTELARLVNGAFVQIAKAFQQIDFDNFESFEAEVEIAPGVETRIANKFGRDKIPFIPRYYLVVNKTGNGLVTAGDNAWTSDNIYLKCISSTSPFIGTVRFFR